VLPLETRRPVELGPSPLEGASDDQSLCPKLREGTVVRPMRVSEVKDEAERARLWPLAVAAFPPYADYQKKTEQRIPVFVTQPRH
jgi:F420H(2)-dependent quinone reductase